MEVLDLADFFIAHFQSRGEDNDLNNTKLNKLLYFANGFYLAMSGEKLFDNDVMAWKYGPVIPLVYWKYKNICISSLNKLNIDLDIFNNDEMVQATFYTVNEFGDYTAGKLTEITHECDSPWSETAEGDIIPTEKIRNFFIKKHLNDVLAREQNDPFYSKLNVENIIRSIEEIRNGEGVEFYLNESDS